MNSQEQQDPLSGVVIGAAIEVHKALGPGLLEQAYSACLAHELSLREVQYRTEAPVPVEYKNIRLATSFRIDFLIENQLVIELKSVEEISKLHQAQLLTYLRLAKLHTGLILNFNVTSMRNGIIRMVR